MTLVIHRAKQNMIPVRNMSSSSLFLLFFFSAMSIISPFFVVVAFSTHNRPVQTLVRVRRNYGEESSTWWLAARRHNRNHNNNEERDDTVPIPQLPAGSSFSSNPQSTRSSTTTEHGGTTTKASSPPAFARQKFELQYTCKVCDTRNSNRVSRIAYTKGVVICVCKGCETKHMIADHLGWTDYDGGFEGDTNTIEDFFRARGEEDVVHRVSEEVFALEKVLGKSSNSGSILGEGGQLELE